MADTQELYAPINTQLDSRQQQWLAEDLARVCTNQPSGLEIKKGTLLDRLVDHLGNAGVDIKVDAGKIKLADGARVPPKEIEKFVKSYSSDKSLGLRNMNNHILVAYLKEFREHANPKLISSAEASVPWFSKYFDAIKQSALDGKAMDKAPEGSGIDERSWGTCKKLVPIYKAMYDELGYQPSMDVFAPIVHSQTKQINNYRGMDDPSINRQAHDAEKNLSKGEEKPSQGPGKFYKGISKPPYRALAKAMKMIQQLTGQMFESFQKTIGAGGFYKSRSAAEYDEFVGYGQNIEARQEALTSFFFGGNKKVFDDQGKEKTGEPFGPFKMSDEIKARLYKRLGVAEMAEDEIRPAIENLIKNDLKKVEENFDAVGLRDALREWTKVNGTKGQLEALEKAKEQDAIMQQKKTGWDLENIGKVSPDERERLSREYIMAQEEGDATKIAAVIKEIGDVSAEVEKTLNQQVEDGHMAGWTKSPKGQEMRREAEITMLHNRLDSKRLDAAKPELSDAQVKEVEQDQEYYKDIDHAMRFVLANDYSPDDLNRGMHTLAHEQYLRDVAGRIFAKALDHEDEPMVLSDYEKDFLTKLYGAGAENKLIDDTGETLKKLKKTMEKPLETELDKYDNREGRKAIFEGTDPSNPPTRHAQSRTGRRTVERKMKNVETILNELGDSPEIQAERKEFERLGGKAKDGGIDGSQ